MRRLSAVGSVIVVCLALGGLPALAQETSGEPEGLATELLFEATLPPGAMGGYLERINSGGLTVAPGAEAVIGIDNEGMRGRFLYVESGQIAITPMVDSPVWLEGAALGGSAGVARAGEEALLQPGDLIFIPVLAVEDLVPGATIVVVNRGSEPAVTRGFHAHAYESFAGWPEGISDNEGAAEAHYPADLEAAVAGDVTYRLSRTTAPIGSVLPLDDAALFTLVDVYEGKVQRTVSDGDGSPPFWNPIHGGYLPGGPDWAFELVVDGDGPAVVSEMTVVPVGGTAAPEPQE
jgi:hypothetical protein